MKYEESDKRVALRLCESGLMWQWDRLRPLEWAEYEQWLTQPLPMGWMVIAEPKLIGEILR